MKTFMKTVADILFTIFSIIFFIAISPFAFFLFLCRVTWNGSYVIETLFFKMVDKIEEYIEGSAICPENEEKD